jgi:hypothetical protein
MGTLQVLYSTVDKKELEIGIFFILDGICLLSNSFENIAFYHLIFSVILILFLLNLLPTPHTYKVVDVALYWMQRGYVRSILLDQQRDVIVVFLGLMHSAYLRIVLQYTSTAAPVIRWEKKIRSLIFKARALLAAVVQASKTCSCSCPSRCPCPCPCPCLCLRPCPCRCQ